MINSDIGKDNAAVADGDMIDNVTVADEDVIDIRGCRVNNLKNVSLAIPHGKFVVVTGVSGSGKSSLAFNTLYAEGQRRYVESLSAYARQFMGRLNKPDFDTITGLPPAIAVEQRVSSRNTRSTVGTSTELYDYLRMLFARIGRIISPVSGVEVRRHTVEDVAEWVNTHGEGRRYAIMTRLQDFTPSQLQDCRKRGYSFIYHNAEFKSIEDLLENPLEQTVLSLEQTALEQATAKQSVSDTAVTAAKQSASQTEAGGVYLVIDRLAVRFDEDSMSRQRSSLETAFDEGDGRCYVAFPPSLPHPFSTRLEADGMLFDAPHEHLFSYNSPMGACPTCEGVGVTLGIDERLVIPNSALSVYDGCVSCWHGAKHGAWQRAFCLEAERLGFPVFTPYRQLTPQQKHTLWHTAHNSIDAFFDMVRANQYKVQYRVMLSRYRGKTTCPTCGGARLRAEALYVKVGGRTIAELLDMSITDLKEWFSNLELMPTERAISERLRTEINSRLHYLEAVGLGYLKLNRMSATLSGGESQRISLTTALGSSLVGSLYVLDEPSIGLHSRDTQRLIGVLKDLQQLGNTVVVVEHDEEIMRAADLIIDLGPGAGTEGGEVVFMGSPNDLPSEPITSTRSHTLRYLTGAEGIDLPLSPRMWSHSLWVRGARMNNLKNIDVQFPLNVLTVVTGVSGSGKSTLVRGILYPAVKWMLDECCDAPGEHDGLEGSTERIEAVELVDQNPIGRSSRSTPVTYVKAFDDIRYLMASQPLAKQTGITAQHFSFNLDHGRCEACKGTGTIMVEMQFMADIELVCDSCHGQRFKRDVLDIRYKGLNIYDIFELTVSQAISFFADQPQIVSRLQPLDDVGLGYVKLGQSSSTLSGGESQRVKLAYYLAQEKPLPTLFIFDEPTTGLHFHDIKKLLRSFAALIDRGHSVVVIEHNKDVIRAADYVIELGPEGGDKGGCLLSAAPAKRK